MATHPVLPTGLNSWDINGDEINGAGVNETVWPDYVETFEALDLIAVSPEMLAVFENECPDIVFPKPDNTVVMPREYRELVIRGWAA